MTDDAAVEPSGGWRKLLRSLPVLQSELPETELGDFPAEPLTAFLGWLRDAIDRGFAAPHAMTLATTDGEGTADARVLILKDVDAHGLYFATDRRSSKGRQLRQAPAAALTFFWPEGGRQVRVRGRVTELDDEASARDFLERPAESRALALVARQDEELVDPGAFAAEMQRMEERVQREPELVAEHWRAYRLEPEAWEFWQARPDRVQLRVEYTRAAEGWDRRQLQP